MTNKKIFSDQLEIAIKLTGIDSMTRDDFKDSYEKQMGSIPQNTRFPNLMQIYDKYCKFETNKNVIKSTPKKASNKAEQLLSNDSCKNVEEVKVGAELQMSATKSSKVTKNDKSNQQAQLNIENKINEANNLVVKQKETRREGSGGKNSRGRSTNSPPNKHLIDEDPAGMVYTHHNPHIQMKDPRREGKDNRAISGGNRDNYIIPAHSPSTRQPTTAEKYTLFGHSEDSTICKTPQTAAEFAKAAYFVSPYFFNRNAESRFNFARSMDPRTEAEYLNIPAEIQEILERNIRTMSNKAHKSSIDNTSSTDVIDFRENWSIPFDQMQFEDEKNVYYASRRSSPHNRHAHTGLSPRSQIDKKSGSLTRRQYEDYLIESMSNHLCSRTSLHSKPDMIASGGWYRYDSESTSNHDYQPDTNNNPGFQSNSNRGRK